MGYLFPTNASKVDVVNEVVKGAIKFAVRGNMVYALHTDCESGMKYISVTKLMKHGNSYGYKVMDERMHPYYYDCPESILKLSEDDSESAKGWREACRQHAQDKKNARTLYDDLVLGKERYFMHRGRLVKFVNTYTDQYLVGKDIEADFIYRYRIREIKRVDNAAKVA